jgi:hypothetical protein
LGRVYRQGAKAAEGRGGRRERGKTESGKEEESLAARRRKNSQKNERWVTRDFWFFAFLSPFCG